VLDVGWNFCGCRTEEVVEIKPRRVPVFRAGSILKREVIQGNQG